MITYNEKHLPGWNSSITHLGQMPLKDEKNTCNYKKPTGNQPIRAEKTGGVKLILLLSVGIAQMLLLFVSAIFKKNINLGTVQYNTVLNIF